MQSEYDVESLFIDRIQSIEYDYIDLKNYDDAINIKFQLGKINVNKRIEKKH